MNKLTAYINGFNSTTLANHTPDSKRKAALYATLIWLPVMLWAAVGFLTSWAIYSLHPGISLFVGLVMAFAIFLIERSIIISNGGFWIALTRIGLGTIVALLGAQFIDVVIFSKDIEGIRQVANQEHAQQFADSAVVRHNTNLSYAITEQNRLEADYNAKLADWKCEIEGNCGTGRIGDGKVAKKKEAIMLAAKSRLDYQEKVFKGLQSEANGVYKAAIEGFVPPSGVLVEFEYLDQLLEDNPAADFMYWLFTGLLFFIEFLVIIIKTVSKQSVLEAEIEYIRESQLDLLKYKLETLRQQLALSPKERAAKSLLELTKHLLKLPA